MTRNRRRVLLCSAAYVLAAVAGCGAEDPTTSPTGGFEERTSAITERTFTDATGTIEVMVKTCDVVPPLNQQPAFTNCAYCWIDTSQWVRVGGGGQILGEDTTGAMLQASFPSPNGFPNVNSYGCTGPADPRGDFQATWVVRSSGANHRVQAYVIGMRLRDTWGGPTFKPATTIGVDAVTLAVNPPANYTVDVTEANLQPSCTNGCMIIGGGAFLFTAVPSNSITAPTNAYLTESRPVDTASGRVWRASARSQVTPAPDEPLKSYAIGIEGCPWTNGHCFTYPFIHSFSTGAFGGDAGYGTATYAVPGSWITTSPGGRSPTTSGAGRYLADLIPYSNSGETQKGTIVRSKPNNTDAGRGRTYSDTLVVGRFEAPYTFNAVRFDSNSTAVSRQTGNDLRLQQSTADPNSAPRRWHLEQVGAATYRLRNGHPDQGTDCAYRVAGSTTVRVKACGNGDEFKWTPLSGVPLYEGPFQLKNVQANQCLDNNGQGSVTGDVLLKSCQTGKAAQRLFLDHYSQPDP